MTSGITIYRTLPPPTDILETTICHGFLLQGALTHRTFSLYTPTSSETVSHSQLASNSILASLRDW